MYLYIVDCYGGTYTVDRSLEMNALSVCSSIRLHGRMIPRISRRLHVCISDWRCRTPRVPTLTVVEESSMEYTWILARNAHKQVRWRYQVQAIALFAMLSRAWLVLRRRFGFLLLECLRLWTLRIITVSIASSKKSPALRIPVTCRTFRLPGYDLPPTILVEGNT